MTESNLKHRPSDQHSLKARITLTQIRIQQSFKQPLKCLSSVLTALVYVQCLQYPIDLYSEQWVGSSVDIVNYLNIQHYLQDSSSLITSTIGLVYVLYSVICVVLEKRIKGHGLFVVAKAMQMLFSSVLFIWVVGTCCSAMDDYFTDDDTTQTQVSVALAILCLVLFTSVVILQTLVRFDFVAVCLSCGVVRTSNWSTVMLQLYIVANQLSSQLSSSSSNAHLIVMCISIAFCVFVFLVKWQLQEDLPIRIELMGMILNVLAIAMLAAIKLLSMSFHIGLWAVLSLISLISISQIHFFSIAFQLENVNKWSTSQIMISYAAKLRKVLLNYDDYYFNTLFLGYYEIHQQKCDNQSCPLRELPNEDSKKQDKFQQLIRKIYNDGCKLTPVNPELQLQYALFHYESGAKQKSLKMLLEIKESDLSLDKYYKFTMLKNRIHKQISELQHQDFLDLLSEIKVKDLQQKIYKKFEEAAFVNLQFWSILNEDHPNFRKLLDVGKSRVIISNEVNSLYRHITQIAHSERVASLFIHYLNEIQNDEKLFGEIYEQIKNQQGFEQKIVIEDWPNNCNPILIISNQQQNVGTIIDLNTKCATILGYDRYDLLGRDIKLLFPGPLLEQIQKFINPKYDINSDVQFYVGHSNGFAIKFTRKIQNYNSIETGLSVIASLQQKFVPNYGFLLFTSSGKLISMSASCLQLLDLSEQILHQEQTFGNMFTIPLSQINEQKTILKMTSFFKNNKIYLNESDGLKSLDTERTFNVYKKENGDMFVINLLLYKSQKVTTNARSMMMDTHNIVRQQNFSFQIRTKDNQFMYLGSDQHVLSKTLIQSMFVAKFQQKQNNEVFHNYGQNITTLRLHQNYIKVIQQSQADSEDGDKNSQASTNTQLIQNLNVISKKDQQIIFESRQTYCRFVDNFVKKIYIRTGLVICLVLSICIYILLYFVLKDNYSSIYQNYQKLSLQNQIIGEIAACENVLLQSKYRVLANNTDADDLLLQNYLTRMVNLQYLISQYEDTYMISVYISNTTRKTFRSDQFILAFISQFSKLKDIAVNSGIDSLDFTSNSSIYVQINGNVTKKIMENQVLVLKQQSYSISNKAMYINISINASGILLSLVLIIFLMLTLMKINQYKIEILSVFLETTQKDIQNYSQKTQNFLVALHVDDSNQTNQASGQIFDNKKGGAMFTKKKSFKSTNFQKSPYWILAVFYIFVIAYYIHSFTFNYQKQVFMSNFVEYMCMTSQYNNIFNYQQARLYRKMIDVYGSTSTITDADLVSDVNTNLLQYQRDYFTWHYKTFGVFEEYHAIFSSIFMKDICNGSIAIDYACDAGTMAENGTLLMLTDITIQNQKINFSEPLTTSYEYELMAIKAAHTYLHDKVMSINTDYFSIIYQNLTTILIIWILVTSLAVLFIEFYVQNFIVKDTALVKSMLKFFPVSFARESPGVRNFVATIISQQNIRM